jgi:hypothetical protein
MKSAASPRFAIFKARPLSKNRLAPTILFKPSERLCQSSPDRRASQRSSNVQPRHARKHSFLFVPQAPIPRPPENLVTTFLEENVSFLGRLIREANAQRLSIPAAVCNGGATKSSRERTSAFGRHPMVSFRKGIWAITP